MGRSEKHGDNGTNITLLCCYSTLLCVGALHLGGACKQRTKWKPNRCPNPFQSCCNCNCYVLFSWSWCGSSFKFWLYLCLGCRWKKLYLNLFQGLLTKGWLFVDQYVGASALERYWYVAPSSGIGEKEAQFEMSCPISPLFFHGELEISFCLPLFMLFSSSVSYIKKRITQTQSQ